MIFRNLLNDLITNKLNLYRSLGIKFFIHNNMSKEIKFLNQQEAINLDQELFNEYGFSVDQLMELAGLSVAVAVAERFKSTDYSSPIVCCGPGNNGGDGLVCARHLKLFGYRPTIVCPKPGQGQLYQNLLLQCEKFNINVINQLPESLETFNSLGDLIIDAIFGFSFKPPNRNEDFAKLLKLMHESSGHFNKPLVSVDIPSGWHVETGPSEIESIQSGIEPRYKVPILQPDCLVSLTAPKKCAQWFAGRYHYLGGRFCPESIQVKYKLNLPEFQGTSSVVLLTEKT